VERNSGAHLKIRVYIEHEDPHIIYMLYFSGKAERAEEIQQILYSGFGDHFLLCPSTMGLSQPFKLAGRWRILFAHGQRIFGRQSLMRQSTRTRSTDGDGTST
jgi:hypothetical protein